MLHYNHPKAKQYISPLLNMLGVITVAIMILGYSQVQKLTQHSALITYGAVLMCGLLSVATIKGTYVTKGRLEYDSNSQPELSNSISLEVIETEGNDDTVLDTLEKELVGLSVVPLPLAVSFWNHVSSNRSLGLITYSLRISDPVKKGTYARFLYLDLLVSPLAGGKVRVEQRYRLSSPMMQKVAKRVIPQTDFLVREILSRGTVDLSADCSFSPAPEKDSASQVDRFELDYLDVVSKSQFELPARMDLGSLEEIDFDKIRTSQAEAETETGDSSVVEEFELVSSDLADNRGQFNETENNKEALDLVINKPESVQELESGPINIDNQMQEAAQIAGSAGLEGLGQISYSNFDEYADTILDS